MINYLKIMLMALVIMGVLGGGLILFGWLYTKSTRKLQGKTAEKQQNATYEAFAGINTDGDNPFDFEGKNVADNLHSESVEDDEDTGFSFDD